MTLSGTGASKYADICEIYRKIYNSHLHDILEQIKSIRCSVLKGSLHICLFQSKMLPQKILADANN